MVIRNFRKPASLTTIEGIEGKAMNNQNQVLGAWVIHDANATLGFPSRAVCTTPLLAVFFAVLRSSSSTLRMLRSFLYLIANVYEALFDYDWNAANNVEVYHLVLGADSHFNWDNHLTPSSMAGTRFTYVLIVYVPVHSLQMLRTAKGNHRSVKINSCGWEI